MAAVAQTHTFAAQPSANTGPSQWVADFSAGRLAIDRLKLEQVVKAANIESVVTRELGPYWLRDFNPTIVHAVLRLVDQKSADSSRSGGSLLIEAARRVLYPVPDVKAEIDLGKTSLEGSKRERAMALFEAAAAFRDPGERAMALACALRVARSSLRIPAQTRALKGLSEALVAMPQIDPAVELDCATQLAWAGFSREPSRLFTAALTHAEFAGARLDNIEGFFHAALSTGKIRTLEKLATNIRSAPVRRHVDYLFGTLAGDETRSVSSLELLAPSDRFAAVRSAVNCLIAKGNIELALEVAINSKARPISSETALPFARRSPLLTEEVRARIIDSVPEIRKREDRVEVLLAMARLGSSARDKAMLISEAEDAAGAVMRYPDEHYRHLLVAVARIAILGTSAIAELQQTEAAARLVKQTRDPQWTHCGWSERNLALVAAGYLLAGKESRAFEILGEREKRAGDRISFYPQEDKEPGRRRQTAYFLKYFGAHTQAFDIAMSTAESKYGERAALLRSIGYSAAWAQDSATVARALKELGPKSLESYRLQAELFEAEYQK